MVRDELDWEERLRRPTRGEPVWLLAERFPRQGDWTVDVAVVFTGAAE